MACSQTPEVLHNGVAFSSRGRINALETSGHTLRLGLHPLKELLLQFWNWEQPHLAKLISGMFRSQLECLIREGRLHELFIGHCSQFTTH